MLSYHISGGNGVNGLGKLPENLIAKIKYGDVYGEASSTDIGVNATLTALVDGLNIAAAAFKLPSIAVSGVLTFTAAKLALDIANRISSEALVIAVANEPERIARDLLPQVRAISDEKARIRFLAENADDLNMAFRLAANAKDAADAAALIAAALIKATEKKAAEKSESKAGLYLSWGSVILLAVAGSVGTYYLVRHYKHRQRPELEPAT